MDGFELLENIKADERFKKYFHDHVNSKISITLGVNDYLTKSFSREELLVITKNILENRIVRILVAKELPLDIDYRGDVDTFIKTLKILIEKYMASNLLSVLFLATEMSLSERQLLRKVKVLTGFTPVQLIKEIRLMKAKLLLGN